MIPAVIGALYSLPDDLLMEVLHLLLESHAYWDEQKVEDSGEENMEEGELPDMEDTSKEYAFVINPIAQTLVSVSTVAIREDGCCLCCYFVSRLCLTESVDS